MSSSRYSRQEILPEIGKDGQLKLRNARVVIVGCGGLGAIVGAYLAGAGVGYIKLIDGDVPHVSNLHRQVFFKSNETRSKAEALKDHLSNLNPTIDIEAIPVFLDKTNIEELIEDSDIIVECTDLQNIKYLVNDACVINYKCMIYGAVHKFEGYVSVFDHRASENTIHLRDIFPEEDTNLPSCAEIGVLGTAAGMIAMLQANEALKIILEIGAPLKGYLLTYNVLENTQFKVKLKKSFDEDLYSIYENNDYELGEENSLIREFNWKDINDSNSDDYNILCTLDSSPIKSHSIKYINSSNPQLFENHLINSKTNIICCPRGNTSKIIVEQLLKKFPDLQIGNLTGGISAAV